MAKKSAKIEKILDTAIEVIKSEGDFGLTMRKVASTADMSLSNVQYYFKTKDDLLKAMADRYFKQCSDELQAQPAVNSEQELNVLLTMLLTHVYDLSDMCRLFREFWAISTRNQVMENYLLEYYKEMSMTMQDKLSPLAKNDMCLSQAVSVLIPFVEGYSITAKALPRELDSMIELLQSTLLRTLKGSSE
ncbi:transcriptional regulator [Vibrio sp. JCM 19236]|nr:transcriptional regulator [Vibrio sp. JCM 19236]